MGHYGVVVRDRRLRVHNNVPYEFSVALSRENVVYVLPSCPVEGMRDAVLGVLKNVIHEGDIMVGSES